MTSVVYYFTTLSERKQSLLFAQWCCCWLEGGGAVWSSIVGHWMALQPCLLYTGIYMGEELTGLISTPLLFTMQPQPQEKKVFGRHDTW